MEGNGLANLDEEPLAVPQPVPVLLRNAMYGTFLMVLLTVMQVYYQHSSELFDIHVFIMNLFFLAFIAYSVATAVEYMIEPIYMVRLSGLLADFSGTLMISLLSSVLPLLPLQIITYFLSVLTLYRLLSTPLQMLYQCIARLVEADMRGQIFAGFRNGFSWLYVNIEQIIPELRAAAAAAPPPSIENN